MVSDIIKVSVTVQKIDFETGKGKENFVYNSVNTWFLKGTIGGVILNEHRRDHPLAKLNGLSKIVKLPVSDSHYIQFGHTSVLRDSGQTAVPFFDAQIVAPVPAVPLSGFGVQFRNVKTSGGFVVPAVSTINYAVDLDELFAYNWNLIYTRRANEWINYNWN